MKKLRDSSEAEMILTFLRGEYGSDRFSEELKQAMDALNAPESLLTAPDLQNAAENALRKNLMGEFRGYGQERELFERFPRSISWQLCRFDESDLEYIQYIDYSYWNELSLNTRSPLRAAEPIRQGVKIYGQSTEGFLRAAEYLEAGGAFPPLILLTYDFSRLVAVEGHLRLTAYALIPRHFQDVEALVGVCEDRAAFERWAK